MTGDPGSEAFIDDGQGDVIALPGFATDPAGILRRRWKAMLAVIVLGLAGCAAFVYTQEPSFTSRATVMVSSQRISEQFVRSTVETDQLEKVSAIVGELLSRNKLAELIDKFGIYEPDEDDGEEELTLAEKVALLRSKIRIAPDYSNAPVIGANSTSTVFEVVFTGSDPQTAAAVANELAMGFTDIHLRLRSRQARLTTEFLRRELERVEAELLRQERAITEFKQAHRGELPSELATALGRLDRMQSERQSLALQVAEAESRLVSLRESGNDVAPDSPEALLRTLKNREKEQLALYTPDHPNLVSLRNQIASVEAQIAERSETPNEEAEDVSLPAAAARLTITELRRQLSETIAEIEELDRRVALVPVREEELAGMEQRAQILREDHQEFLRKVNQAKLAQAVESAQQGERATILDSAVPPNEPDTKVILYVIVLIVATFGGSAAIAILLELVDSVIVSASEIEASYRVPVVGSISRLG